MVYRQNTPQMTPRSLDRGSSLPAITLTNFPLPLAVQMWHVLVGPEKFYAAPVLRAASPSSSINTEYGPDETFQI